MDKELRRLIHSFMTPAMESPAEACWQPSVDIYRGQRGWLVKFDLAGVRAEDIRLTVEGNRLTVDGMRRDFSVLEDQRAYSMEIAYNRFSRAVELPCDVEHADIKCEYRDGMFLVTILPAANSQ